jgi:hypothetical protein
MAERRWPRLWISGTQAQTIFVAFAAWQHNVVMTALSNVRAQHVRHVLTSLYTRNVTTCWDGDGHQRSMRQLLQQTFTVTCNTATPHICHRRTTSLHLLNKHKSATITVTIVQMVSACLIFIYTLLFKSCDDFIKRSHRSRWTKILLRFMDDNQKEQFHQPLFYKYPRLPVNTLHRSKL